MADKLKLTRLGKEVIPVELVGQSASYQVLQQPKKPAYPRGNEARYSDDYLAGINGTYSLDNILGQHKDGIKEGNWNGLNHFTMGSPLENSEAEEYLKTIAETRRTYNKGMIDGGVIFGISVAQRGRFVLPTKLENKVIVLPSQEFVEYCIQKQI